MWDVFISHASEDKEAVARPLAKRLSDAGVEVWLDAHTLTLGDSLRQKIDEGLAGSQYGIVVLSPSFFAKQWPQQELDGLYAREMVGGKVILPVWHGMNQAQVARFSPILAGRLATSTGRGLDAVASDVLAVLRPHLPPVAPPTLNDLFSKDAVRSMAAADLLPADDAGLVTQVVDRLAKLNPVTVVALRTFLARAPELSAPGMVDRILNAGRDWHAATLVPDCLDVKHRPFAEGLLAQAALHSGSPDVMRKSIEGLGFLGASGWSFALLELLLESSTYLYEKIEYYVTLALARMFQLERASTEWHTGYTMALRGLLDHLERAARKAAERGWVSTLRGSLADVLALCPPDRADLLAEKWMGGGHPDLRALAARALGNMGMQRTVPVLVQQLRRAGEDENARHEAAMALGNIGGDEAAAALEAAWDDPGVGGSVRLALAMLLHTLGDVDRLEHLATRLLASDVLEKLWVYRAMGTSRDPRFVPRVREGLQHSEHTIRAASALALTRLTGNEENRRVERAFAEAGSPMEQVLTTLAVIVAGGHQPDETLLDRLRETLSIESYLYKRLTTDDILSELRSCKSPSAHRIAGAWQRVYATRPAY